MKRREFLKTGLSGLAAIAVGSVSLPHLFRFEAYAANRSIDLTMDAALVEMVDGSQVFHWLFGSAGTGLSFPGPVIFATAGDAITLNLTNKLKEPHAFQIVGTAIQSPTIAPGQTRSLNFTAPAAGTYLYLDPLNAPVNRVLGLHGALVISPAAGNTPYNQPSSAVQQLFNDLGTTPQFPRNARSPAGWQPDRFRIWLQHQVDPSFNARAQADYLAGRPSSLTGAQMSAQFLPRYFTINGKSGTFSAHDPTVALDGSIGQPMLVRILNAGLFTHSNHLHANHFYVLAVNNSVQENVLNLDSLTINPLDRVDWLVPFRRPPDIAGDENLPLRTLIANELGLTIHGPNGSPGFPQSPLVYPMHCHMEQSQTAAGGNYPQGSVAHFNFLGDLDGIDFPNTM
jgi:FtsP/CotA-like multicopper oxidase with cupredoxin domain